MKKKLGIILAILLCVVLVFTFAACKKDKNNENKGGGETKIATDEQIAAMELTIDAYLNSWLKTNAEEVATNQSALLAADMKAQDGFSFTDSKNNVINPTIQVTYSAADKKYTIVVSWAKGAVKKTFVKDAEEVVYTHWAGQMSKASDYELLDDEDAASDTLDSIISAFVSTVNKVTGNVVTGKFGTDVILGFEVLDKCYGLRVKGNIDVEDASKTEVGLVIVDVEDNNKELGGLYYKGAATPADSKIYLQYATTDEDGDLVRENGNIVYNYMYINYADVLGWIKNILPDTKPANDGVWDEADGLSDFLSNEFDVNVGDIVSGVVGMLVKAYEKEGTDGTAYLLDINLGYVMSQITTIIGQFGITSDSIPFLKQIGLDLGTMHGLLGHVSIAAKLADDGATMTDFEIAVNIPECTFYFTADEDSKTAKKWDLPSISFALYLNDFNFVTNSTIAKVIPEEAATKASYFSPTNVDLSGDVYINHTEGDSEKANDTYHFEFVTDINPLEILENGFSSTARAALVIKQSQGDTYVASTATNFLTVTYEQATKDFCVSGTAFGLDNGTTLYNVKFDSEIMGKIKKWLGIDNWQGIGFDEEHGLYIDNEAIAKPSAKALLQGKLVGALTSYYLVKKPKDNAGDNSEVAAAVEISSIGDHFSAFKGLYENLVQRGNINIDTENGSAHIQVTPEVINMVTGAINSTFGAELPTDITDPSDVTLEFNTEGYEDKLYITVTYGTTKYELTFDGSVDDHFIITFKMTLESGREYKVVFDAEDDLDTDSATKWSASVVVDIKNAQGVVENHTEVTLSNFHGKWGDATATKIATLLPSAEAKAAASEVFPADGTGPATKLLDGLMKFLNGDSIEPAVENIGKFIIRQIFAD